MIQTHNGVLFSHKIEQILSFAKHMELEYITLSEIRQTQKDRYHVFFSHMWKLKNKQIERGTIRNREGVVKEGWMDVISASSRHVWKYHSESH